MEIEKVAARAAKRKNNKIAKRYPLFADQFAVTAEAEKERILRQRERAEVWKGRMAERSRKKWDEGLRMREAARQELGEEAFQRREELWMRWFGNAEPRYDGYRLVDFWWQALRGTAWAAENCPNKEKHGDPKWWEPHFNFLLGRYVETTECPTCGLERPKDLEEAKCR